MCFLDLSANPHLEVVRRQDQVRLPGPNVIYALAESLNTYSTVQSIAICSNVNIHSFIVYGFVPV